MLAHLCPLDSTWFQPPTQLSGEPEDSTCRIPPSDLGQQYALAFAYEKKFSQSTSTTHLRWLTFFSRSLARQVASVARDVLAEEFLAAQSKYTALFHARLMAFQLYSEAMANERMLRGLIAQLRAKYSKQRSLDDTAPPLRRVRATVPDLTCLHWLVHSAEDRIYHAVLAFL